MDLEKLEKRTMQAAKYYGPGKVEIIQLPIPKTGPGQVLVEVKYCGICGTDVHAYSMPGIFDWELIPGHEAVGYVREIGEGVDGFSVGDRVAVGPPGDCGTCYACNTGHPNTCPNAFPNTLGIGPGTQGAYAQYVLSHFPQNELFLIPDGVTFEQAVLFDVLGVGFHAVRRSDMKVGDDVVVSGCGSIGLAAIQSARLAGACRLIAFDPDPERRKLALQAGADYALDPTDRKQVEQAKDLFSHTGGAHVCFEAAGHPASTQTCADLCMANGQVMIIGSDNRPFPLVSAALGPKQLDFKLTFTYTKEEIHTLFDLIELGRMNTSVYTTQTAPLTCVKEKLQELASGKLTVARVLLTPNEMN